MALDCAMLYVRAAKSAWEIINLLIPVSYPYKGMAEIGSNARIFGETGKDFELFLFILSFSYVYIPQLYPGQ